MNLLLISLCFLVLTFSLVKETGAAQTAQNGIYIVYMGASDSDDGTMRDDQTQLMSSLTKRKNNAILYSYTYGFSGFAARLSDEEAKAIAQTPGVVSVFPDPVLQLHTTHSWEFLEELSVSGDEPPPKLKTDSTDIIIGVMDTGIWPESKSFSDKGIGPIPSQWKGECQPSKDFPSSLCNRKLIGARYYPDPDLGPNINGTARDTAGHGTHVSSTAAGGLVSGASYYHIAEGIAQGGSPGSRIAVYQVCFGFCKGSTILKGYEDAIRDGVDVLSLSLGGRAEPGPDFEIDPVAIGAFHAVQKGIIVVCSAGNSGPMRKTITNVAPWILTVAASTTDRDFESDITLGEDKTITGGGIHVADIYKSPLFPLTNGTSAKFSDVGITDYQARNCQGGSLNSTKVKGKILVCENEGHQISVSSTIDYAQELGAIGLIIIDSYVRSVPETTAKYPVSAVTEEDGAYILSYINSSSNPVATIFPTRTVMKHKPAPIPAYFSSRGPSYATENVIKPDITAPGANILASWPTNGTSERSSTDPPGFHIISGTSMSCPHVSGIAAAVKSEHPEWSSSAIKSAIMTTAIPTNNMHDPDTTIFGVNANPYDMGSGEVNVSGAFQPGLVYETEISDYLYFLCNLDYNVSTIKQIAGSLPPGFSCPGKSDPDAISNMNYPSIAVTKLKDGESKKVSRTVTNVGDNESVYTVKIDAPSGVSVDVEPSKLQFTKDVKKLTYQVTFKLTAPVQGEMFGSITWTNRKTLVRSPFLVSTD